MTLSRFVVNSVHKHNPQSHFRSLRIAWASHSHVCRHSHSHPCLVPFSFSFPFSSHYHYHHRNNFHILIHFMRSVTVHIAIFIICGVFSQRFYVYLWEHVSVCAVSICANTKDKQWHTHSHTHKSIPIWTRHSYLMSIGHTYIVLWLAQQ